MNQGKTGVLELLDRRLSVITPRLEQLSILPPLRQANVDFIQGNYLLLSSTYINFEFIEKKTVNFAYR